MEKEFSQSSTKNHMSEAEPFEEVLCEGQEKSLWGTLNSDLRGFSGAIARQVQMVTVWGSIS